MRSGVTRTASQSSNVTQAGGGAGSQSHEEEPTSSGVSGSAVPVKLDVEVVEEADAPGDEKI